jgi:hypothetical protein
MDPDSPFAGVALVMIATLALVTAIGVALARPRRTRRAGMLVLLYAALTVIALPWGMAELEAMGLAAVVTKLLEVEGPVYYAVRGAVAILLPIWLKAGILAAGVGLALGVELIRMRAAWMALWSEARALSVAGFSPPRATSRRVAAFGLILCLFVTGFRGGVGYVPLDAEALAARQAGSVRVATAPSVVTVERTAAGFRYLVNGAPDVVRGMGYNPMTAEPDRFRRDFRLMREAGINTVIGWNEAIFDEPLLTAANQEGLGVVLPFDLPIDVDYRDHVVRKRLLRHVVERVERFRLHPAIRMWGIGNEVLHDLQIKDPENRDAFARFLVEAADRIRLYDVTHPVVYREAEDVFVPVLDAALRGKPADRPWFVFGLNFYTPRLDEALSLWASEGVPYAVLVSEFGPHSFHPATRGQGYVRLWRIVRRYPTITIGAVAYVWYAVGPEAIDLVFGFVHDDGTPVDPALEALKAAYLRTATTVDQQRAGATPTPRPPTPTAVRPTPTIEPALGRLPGPPESDAIVAAVVQAAVDRGITGFEVVLERRVGDAVVATVVPKTSGAWYEAVARQVNGVWTVVGISQRPPR